MATIDITRAHQLDLDTAKVRAAKIAEELEQKLGIAWRWEGDSIRFHAEKGAAKGTQGVVRVSASNVRVEIDLPFLLRAMKGVIVGKVEKRLDALAV